MPTLPFLQNFSRAFIRMDPLNVLAKFEICSFPRSWDKRGYPKNLGYPWICPRFLFSKIFHELFFGYPLLFQEREKLRISNLASTFRGSIRINAYEKVLRKRSVGVSRDCPTFLGTPIISGTGKATDFKFGRNIHSVHPHKSPLQILRKRGVGVSRDCQIVWVPLPPIISGTKKATKFKFILYAHWLAQSEQKPATNLG